MGTIIAGQGTSHIQIKTPTDALETKADEKGLKGIWFSGPYRGVRLNITAIFAGSSHCADKRLLKSIIIGRQSRVPNRPANVTNLILEKTEIVLSCDISGSAESIIDVSVTAADPENDVILYNYSVSAGKIIGTEHTSSGTSQE